MIVDVEIGGRVRRVELERKGHGWVGSIDGRELAIDAVQGEAGWSVIVGPPEGGHESGVPVKSGFSRTSFEIAIDDRGDGALTVSVGGCAFEARIVDPRAFVRRGRDHGAGGPAGLRQVIAPMPGRVVSVLVKPGDQVTARQGLVVVEAMKMENELRAPGDAVVRDVRVAQGASVEAGAVLVVLE